MKTSGTKIVNQKGEEVILRGYNLGLWLSRSFWGLPISMTHNSSDDERYSPVNSMEIDYELFSNENLQAEYKEKKESGAYEGTYEEYIEELNNTFYSNQITETDIQTLADTGINLVRVPVEWTFFMRPVYDESKDDGNKHDADYNNYGALKYIDTTLETASDEDKEFLENRLEYLDWIVDECGKKNIYVIFDLHVAPGGLNAGGTRIAPLFFEKGEEGEARRACAIRIWKIIAENFKNEPTVAGYDIINEPAGFNQESTKYTYVIDFYDETYDAIREIEENCENKHIIIMEEKVKSYNDSTVEIEMDTTHGGLPNPSEYNWTNVVYSKHDYFHNFHNLDDGMDEEWQKDNPDINTMKARIMNSIEETKYTMEEYNIPVWIGEFSCHAYYNDSEGNIVGTFQDADGNRFTINEEYTEEIWDYQIQLYEENNISYNAWTYKACWEKYFGLVYYGRKTNVNRVDLKTATYDQIYNIFADNSADIMNYNETFHNIIKEHLEIFAGVDISTNGDGSVIAKLSNDKTTLTISGIGDMITTWTTSNLSPWYAYKNTIENVKIEEGITNIGRLAFYGCTELKNIEIPNSLTNIGHSAFFKCSSLKSVEIKGNVTNIGNNAFYKCSSLKNIYVYASNPNYVGVEGVLYNKDKTKIIKYPEGKENTEYTIPSSVTNIEEYAFYGTTLTTIIIPKDVTEIGKNAFENCENLTIICKSGTTAETYAIENVIPYLLDTGLPKITFTTDGTAETVKSASTKVIVEDIEVETVTGIDYTNLKYYWGKRSEGVSESEIVTKFSENQTITTPKQQGTYYLWILARDKVGNEKIQRSNAFYIDALAPTASVNITSDGTVTITANEELQELEGWTLSEDKLILTKKYDESKTETVIIRDLIGNETEILIDVIIKNDSELVYKVEYSTKSLTNEDVTVIITSNKELQEAEGWELSSDKLTLTKEYIENTSENVTIKDLDGNEQIVNIKITNIDKIPPTITLNTQVSSNAIIIDTEAIDELAGIDEMSYKYFIKEINDIYDTGVTDGVSHIFASIKTNTTYNIKVEVSDKVGNIASREIEVITPESDLIMSENLIVDEENLVIKNIQPNTTSEQLRQNLQSEMEYEIIDENKKVIFETSLIGTGYKIKMNNNKIYTLLVIGDSNGDGQTNFMDILQINKHRLNKASLTGEYLIAADVNEDGIVDFKDILQINKFRLEKIEEL